MLNAPDVDYVNALHVAGYGDPPVLAVKRIPAPTCGPGDVVVAPRAAAVHAADLLMMKGDYQVRPELPFIPGMEVAGRVIEVGEDITHVACGDKVLAMMTRGAIAGAVSVPGLQVARVSESMAYSTAAAFGIEYVTAYAALYFRARMLPGETVLITGARGGVARAAAQLAKAAGARVLVASRDPAAAHSELGDHVDDVVAADPSSIAEAVKSRTGGRGADVVVDVVGGPLLGQAIRATAWEGRVVIVGFAGGTPMPIKPGHLLVKNISVSGLQSTDYWTRAPEEVQAALTEIVALEDAGALSFRPAREFALDEIDAARRAVEEEANRAVVVRIDQTPDPALKDIQR